MYRKPVEDPILCIHQFQKKTDYSVLKEKKRKISFLCAKIFKYLKKKSQGNHIL